MMNLAILQTFVFFEGNILLKQQFLEHTDSQTFWRCLFKNNDDDKFLSQRVFLKKSLVEFCERNNDFGNH